jgi:hypothetical protein
MELLKGIIPILSRERTVNLKWSLSTENMHWEMWSKDWRLLKGWQRYLKQLCLKLQFTVKNKSRKCEKIFVKESILLGP